MHTVNGDADSKSARVLTDVLQSSSRMSYDSEATGKPALESARAVAKLVLDALTHQLDMIKDIDEKANYLGAGAFVLIAGYIAALATKTPIDPHVQDVAVLGLLIDLLALGTVVFTWWPRQLLAEPDPTGLVEKHLSGDEADLYRTAAKYGAHAYTKNRRVIEQKNLGIRLGLLTLVLGSTISVAAVAATILLGVLK